MKHRKQITLFCLWLIQICYGNSRLLAYGNNSEQGTIVDKYYESTGYKRTLFGSDTAMRSRLIRAIGNAALLGLDKSKYNYEALIASNTVRNTDSAKTVLTDRLYINSLFSFATDLYKGYQIGKSLSYDELSKVTAVKDDQFILQGICDLSASGNIDSFLSGLQPNTTEYALLKKATANALAKGNKDTLKYLNNALNLYRWIKHFHFEKYIVVSTGTTMLQYYSNDSVPLTSKVIVGKPKTKTPLFAAYCTDVILYPYWTVPTSIATKELLPKFKRSKAAIDAMNMQVLDKKGNVVDHTAINFHRYSAGNLPYTFRQSTGCDNSLGIIKFNLTDPFSVYLHDTNTKKLFETTHRYYSHGCMRVEKAIELGNMLLNNKIDEAYLTSCLKDQKPVSLLLLEKIPVFVIYDLVTLNEDSTVSYSKDTYNLF